MTNNFSEKTQFDYLYDALAEKYPGLVADDNQKASIFQFTQFPVAASWGGGNNVNVYDVANSVPVNLDGFYVPGDALDVAYNTLLLSIRPKIGDNNPDYKKMLIKIDDLTNLRNSTVADATSAYYQWAADNKKSDGTPAESKQEWFNDAFGGKGWADKINNLDMRTKELNSEMSSLLTSLDAGLSKAIKNLTADTMTISHGSKTIDVPRVTIEGNIDADKVRWDSYSQNEYDLDVIINKDATIKTPWKTIYSTTVKQSCWNTDVETHINTSRIIMDNNYNLRVKAVGLQAYKITRGIWYDPSFVTPSVEITQGAVGVTNDTFFGLNGTLHLIPELIVVMYKPTITLTVSTQVYKQEFEANADAGINWINIVGFRFKIDGLASLQPVEGKNGTTTVTFQSPDNANPQILGVTSKLAYNGNS